MPGRVVECPAPERAHVRKKLTLTDPNRIRAVSARDVERMTLLNLEAAMKHHLITTSFLMASVIVSGTVADAKSYSGSTAYRGTITRVTSNADGTRTVTNTDAGGAGSSRVIAPKAPGIVRARRKRWRETLYAGAQEQRPRLNHLRRRHHHGDRQRQRHPHGHQHRRGRRRQFAGHRPEGAWNCTCPTETVARNSIRRRPGATSSAQPPTKASPPR